MAKTGSAFLNILYVVQIKMAQATACQNVVHLPEDAEPDSAHRGDPSKNGWEFNPAIIIPVDSISSQR